ncbi:MAG: transcriptional regulator [Robiginitomaculum sp.]|nr:MAG: transcriptional regulator [Robiginitomaculum sp.]
MDTQFKSYLGGQVRHFRRSAGLTQEALATKIERTAEAISNIERARSAPSLETLIALAAALDIPMRDFFPTGSFEDGTSPNRLKREAEVAVLVRGLSDNQLELAMAQLKAIEELS